VTSAAWVQSGRRKRTDGEGDHVNSPSSPPAAVVIAIARRASQRTPDGHCELAAASIASQSRRRCACEQSLQAQ
jgi:hypothetical protein